MCVCLIVYILLCMCISVCVSMCMFVCVCVFPVYPLRELLNGLYDDLEDGKSTHMQVFM